MALSILKHWATGVVRKSSVAARCYALASLAGARIDLLRGRHYSALAKLWVAQHRLGREKLTQPHWKRSLAVLNSTCRRNGQLVPHAENRLLGDGAWLARRHVIERQWSVQPLADRLRLRKHHDDGDDARQGNLIILKHPGPSSSERGVILLKYNPTFEELPALFDLPRLAEKYRFVLEPSHYRSYEPAFALYAGSRTDVLIQCWNRADYEFIADLRTSLVPICLGPGDWVDDSCFAPLPYGSPHTYDVIMVASWSRNKRHGTLFRALSQLHPRRLKVALIGYPADLSRNDIEAITNRCNVAEQCEIFEGVPPAEVARLLAQSRLCALLSDAEGFPKAAVESLFCNTPLLIYRNMLGFPFHWINGETGITADDHELADALAWMVDNHDRFTPRRWALATTGYVRATETLNAALRDLAFRSGEPWTRDIVAKVNRPNLRYASEEDRLEMEPVYARLAEYLRQPAGC